MDKGKEKEPPVFVAPDEVPHKEKPSAAKPLVGPHMRMLMPAPVPPPAPWLLADGRAVLASEAASRTKTDGSKDREGRTDKKRSVRIKFNPQVTEDTLNLSSISHSATKESAAFLFSFC